MLTRRRSRRSPPPSTKPPCAPPSRATAPGARSRCGAGAWASNECVGLGVERERGRSAASRATATLIRERPQAPHDPVSRPAFCRVPPGYGLYPSAHVHSDRRGEPRVSRPFNVRPCRSTPCVCPNTTGRSEHVLGELGRIGRAAGTRLTLLPRLPVAAS